MEHGFPDPTAYMEDGVYTPKNILLTGGAGFIGSHVVLRLLRNHPQYKVDLIC
jgi:UDP-glucose 4,6-dehydratase